MTELHKNYLFGLGWKLWLVQNFIILIPLLACIPVFSDNVVFVILASVGLINYTSVIINYIFTFALIIDIIAVLLITVGSFSYFRSKKNEMPIKEKEFYIPITGLLWTFFTLLWRIPHYLAGGFDLGISRQFWEIEDNQFYYNLLNNPLMIILQVLAAFCLFLFIYFQEKNLKPISDEKNQHEGSNDIEINIGRATFFGFLNLFAIVLILLGIDLTNRSQDSIDAYGVRSGSTGLFLIIGIVFKISLIPILAILASWKIISLTRFSLTKLIEHPRENDFSEQVVVKQG